MGEFLDFFKNKKNLINILILGILILALPLVVAGLRWQQIIKSRAVADPIVFTGTNVTKKNDGSWVARTATVSVQLTSPLGPPGTYNCTSTYTLYPVTPAPNVDLRVNILGNSSNSSCPVLYQDNQAISTSSCSTDSNPQSIRCNIKSGVSGAHILQLKFGQAATYPGTTCNQVVICNPAVYQVSQ